MSRKNNLFDPSNLFISPLTLYECAIFMDGIKTKANLL